MSKSQRAQNQLIADKVKAQAESLRQEEQAEMQGRANECDMMIANLLSKNSCKFEAQGFITNGQAQVVVNVVPQSLPPKIFSKWRERVQRERVLAVNAELSGLLRSMNCRLFAGVLIGQKQNGQQIQVIAQPLPHEKPAPKGEETKEAKP